MSYSHRLVLLVRKAPLYSGVINVGIYRGMIGRKDTAPFLLVVASIGARIS